VKNTVAAVVFLLFAVGVQAKSKSRTFKEHCDKVFPVAEKMASQSPYRIVLDGKRDMILAVQTGTPWLSGTGDIQIKFTPETNGSCAVTDYAPYSGIRRNGTVFLNRLEKALAAPASAN